MNLGAHNAGDLHIEELYVKITEQYKLQAVLAGVRPTIGKKGNGPKVRHVINFLREHSAFGDIEIRNFAARLLNKRGDGYAKYFIVHAVPFLTSPQPLSLLSSKSLSHL